MQKKVYMWATFLMPQTGFLHFNQLYLFFFGHFWAAETICEHNIDDHLFILNAELSSKRLLIYTSSHSSET